MLKNEKKSKSIKRNEVIDLLVGNDFLVKVPVGMTYKKIFKSEVEDYDLAIKAISTLLSYLKDPSNKIHKKSITDLLDYLNDHIKIDELQLEAGIMLGGAVQKRLDKTKQLKNLFQFLISSTSTNEITKDRLNDVNDTLKNQIEYLANSTENDDKINLILALTTLKEEHLKKRAELNAIANQFGKGSEFETVIYPLFLKIENIKKSQGTAEKAGKKKGEKRFEEEEKLRFRDFVQAKVDAEINAIDGDEVSSGIKNEIKNRIKTEEAVRITHEKQTSKKKYFFLTKAERDNIVEEEINRAIRKQITSSVGLRELNAINRILKLDLFERASILQLNANSRHPVLDIHDKSSAIIENLNAEKSLPSIEMSNEISNEVFNETKKYYSNEVLKDKQQYALHKNDEQKTDEQKDHEQKNNEPFIKKLNKSRTKSNYGLFKPINEKQLQVGSHEKLEKEIKEKEFKTGKKQTHKA